MSDTIKIGVIGGGVSGMTSAIFAAKKAKDLKIAASITIYEANSRLGKKILVTGNGRCNISNDDMDIKHYHGDIELAETVLNRFDNNSLCEFFYSLGVFLKKDASGRIYPMSNQATSILDALRYEVDRLGINVVNDNKINIITPVKNGYLLNNKHFVNRVIIATGGKAAPVHGSDGSGYKILKELNISLAEILPALTPLICKDYNKANKGIRAISKITIKSKGKIIAEDEGELQYTDYGLSGIPSMQVSRFVADEIQKGNTVYAYVDSCPTLSEDLIKQYLINLIKTKPYLPGEMLLSGLIPKRLGLTFLSDLSLSANKNIGIISLGTIDNIVKNIKNKKYLISAVKGFNEAQVCAGGVVHTEIYEQTLELKKHKDIFVCGEIINIDGECGGYNLQWAFSSGYVCGLSIIY